MIKRHARSCRYFISLYQTKIINVPNEKWRITGVWVSETENGWRVAGRLNSHNIFGLPEGHVIVSIVSDDGMILDQKIRVIEELLATRGGVEDLNLALLYSLLTLNRYPQIRKLSHSFNLR